MEPIDSFYLDILAELNNNLEIIPLLKKKHAQYGKINDDVLNLDVQILQSFSNINRSEVLIEEAFSSLVKGYYEIEASMLGSSRIIDGSTTHKTESLADIEAQVENYHKWRENYKKHRNKYSSRNLGREELLTMHRWLLGISLPNECGAFRRNNTGITGSEHEPSHFLTIESDLDSALSDLHSSNSHPIDRIVKFHHQFVSIHPFGNGNGRVIREITNNLLVNLGLPSLALPTSSHGIYREFLVKSDQESYKRLIPFFCNLISEKLKSEFVRSHYQTEI